jgi:hypothetical protein
VSNETDRLRKIADDLEEQVAALKKLPRYRGVRTRSSVTLFGLPLYEIALGPDPETGQIRGHAKGIFAIGDLATGIVALGGLARGVVAVGGLALGVFTIGGASLGILAALGGLAVGAIAVGGAAVGLVAVGGGALGYYACGGATFGKYLVSSLRQDPEALRCFRNFVPWLP